MNAQPHSATRRPSIAFTVVLVIVALLGAIAGAWLDWRMWHPMSAIVITFAAAAIVIVGALAALIRQRPIRLVGFGLLALGGGIVLGQILGPAREPVLGGTGTVTLRLTEPVGASEVAGPADCSMTASGDNFAIFGDPNMRLEIGDQPDEERDFVGLTIAKGDMWEYGRVRDDGVSLVIVIGDAGPFPGDEVRPTETWMTSTPESEIAGTMTQEAGSMSFRGLVIDDGDQAGMRSAVPIPVSGTLEWSCEEISPG